MMENKAVNSLPETHDESLLMQALPHVADAWQAALAHSDFLRHQLAIAPELLAWLTDHSENRLSQQQMQDIIDGEVIDDETDLKRVLRALRLRVMAWLVIKDMGQEISLAEVMQTMTALANLVINVALDFLHRQLVSQFGEPLDSSGMPQKLLVVGMGKLGGGELNVSSDIDLIFIFPEEGETTGSAEEAAAARVNGRKIESYDFFVRLGKRLISVLDEITANGFVFRVDMRLRPNGDSGALVCSLVSLENYFIAQGREWERYAWIKARLINEGENLLPEWKEALQNIIRPFVYRKYLDYGAINAMSELHTQIRREVARKGMSEHIKLGPGGIREIEFIAQVFQLIRGGRETALQARPTLTILQRIKERQILASDHANQLFFAYKFLRQLEHRLQYVNDAQTHSLPKSSSERLKIALSMDFLTWESFLAALETHRRFVGERFEEIFAGKSNESSEESTRLSALWFEILEIDEAKEAVFQLGFKRPQAMLTRLSAFRQSAKYQQLPSSSRERLDAIGPRLIDACCAENGTRATRSPDVTWQRVLDFIEAISRRGSYLAFLQQYPQALLKVAEIMGSSAWAANYLTQHPILLDDVLMPALYQLSSSAADFRAELTQKLALKRGDTEREMDILRETHHAEVFRLLAQDIAGLQTVERLADHLTEIADIVVQTVLELCWRDLCARQAKSDAKELENELNFAVIAYGKLGGKELAYGSDLDLVFLHDETDPRRIELYAKLGQRMNSWLTSQTSAGKLFDTDFRLRPNGDAGLLVTSLEAFREYQLTRAWTWEHQALTRARFCAGNQALGERFEAIRVEVLQTPRHLPALRHDVSAMRDKMRAAQRSEDDEFFDLKHGRGGLLDVEFIVQTLVLAHAHTHPALCANLGNIALLGIAAKLALIPAELANPARDAYREFRHLQHDFRLNEIREARVERLVYNERLASVQALWNEIFAQS